MLCFLRECSHQTIDSQGYSVTTELNPILLVRYSATEEFTEASGACQQNDQHHHLESNQLVLRRSAATGFRFEPVPLGKRHSRDAKDDPFLACALAARAKFVVTRDDDLLVLGKPFGIETIAPSRFLVWVRETHRPGS